MSMKNILPIGALAVTLFSATAAADSWQLDSEHSSLHFVSVKNDHIAETHRFTDIQGSWADNQVTVEIPVVGLDTQIPIRDERMLEHIFKSTDFSVVTATARLDDKLFLQLDEGDTMPTAVELTITIAGAKQTISSHIQVTRLDDDRFLINSIQPLIIDAKAFDLVAGVNKLRELAGLARIDYSVPVTFSVQFTR